MASTRTYGGEGTPVDEQSLGELVATLTRDLSMLVHQEVELATSELAESAKRAGMGAGLLGGAGVFGLWALVLLTFAASYGTATGAGLPTWAGFLIVGGALAMLAGLLAAFGGLSFKRVGGPERTKATVRANLDALKHPRQVAHEVSPAVAAGIDGAGPGAG
jgi:hypothetical protein